MIDSIHQSHLNMWLRCGKQFEFYLTRGPLPPGIAARRGDAVHKAAEINHKQKITSKTDLPLGDLKEAAWETFREYIKEGNFFLPKEQLPDKVKIIKETERQTLDAVEVYREKIAPTIQPTMAEQRFEVDLGLDLPLVGTIDTDHVEEKRAIIEDLKCMVAKNQQWADRQVQPTVYHLGYQELTGTWPEHLRYDLIVPNKKPKHIPLRTERTQSDVERLKRYSEAFLQDIRTGNFRPADPSHWTCNPAYCGWYQICPYGEKRR